MKKPIYKTTEEEILKSFPLKAKTPGWYFRMKEMSNNNVLMLCPTCHIMFDTHVKPKVFKAMMDAGLQDFPESWKKSIYEQAAEAAAKARKRNRSTGPG